jgi:hypothetical protein
MANQAEMKHLLCIWAQTLKYRNINRNLKLQDIQDKKQERNIMRIGVNEEMKQDMNETQLNSTKPVTHESYPLDHMFVV